MSEKLWYNVKDNSVVVLVSIHHSHDVLEYPQHYGLTKSELPQLELGPADTYLGPILWMMMQNGWTRVSADRGGELTIEAATVKDVQATVRFFLKNGYNHDEMNYELRYGPGYYDLGGQEYFEGSEIELFARYGKKTQSTVAAFRESVLLEAEHIDTLKQYNNIAIDYDGTLVDGPNSTLLHKFIKNNADKNYFIVTFRTDSKNLFEKMKQQYPNSPGKEYFKQIVNMNSRLNQQYIDDTNQRAEKNIPLSAGMTRAEELYMTWKGLICKRLGAEVLIDDDKMLVIQGMEKYNINWYDPDEFYENALQEGVNFLPVFHGTSFVNLLMIWGSNKIEPNTSHVIGTKNMYGASVSRDFKYAKLRANEKVNFEATLITKYNFENSPENSLEVEAQSYGAVIKLDKSKLAHNHKFIPVVWDSKLPAEAEEFIPWGIKSVKNFITKVYVDLESFNRFVELLPRGQLKNIAKDILKSGTLSHLPSMSK